jgi:hypothetical protein
MTTWTEQSKTGRIARYDGMLLNSSDFLLLNGITAHYKKNDDAGNTTVVDSSGNGNNGTATQNTEDMSVAGKINTALDFNGTSDYIDCGSTIPTLIAGDNPFSLSLWFKRNEVSTIGRLAGWYDGGVKGTVLSAAFDFVSVAIGTGSILEVINGTGVVSTGSYFNVIVTYDGATANLYLNNVLDGTKAIATVDNSSGTSFVIGKASWANDTYFDGSIDDVRLYGRALTESERDSIYNEGVGTEDINIDTDKLLLTNSTDSEITTTWTNETK